MDAKEKRKRVMARSIKLGHCVCDPAKPCPCPLFKEKNVCTCAGERVPAETSDTATVRLTEFVRSAGCASKISQKDLHQVLGMLPAMEDPRLIVGTATADDAGVFRLTDDTTVVQTVDVFTPGVDDPYTFGRIAACNSLSDVYAMGGRPVTALSVIGFPIYSLPHEVMADIIRGGMAVLEEAGALLLGGHSINDEEIKFGFAVTGLIRDADLVTNAGAQPGDVLVLTKPLGTGIISLAHQIDRASDDAVRAIGESMATLNRPAAEIMVDHGAHACTDVTGFGLLGHLCQMVMESGVTAQIDFDALPLFPGVLEYAREGMYSGANERNAEYSAARTEFTADLSEDEKAVLYDAQTSGGLLVALPADRADAALAAMQSGGVPFARAVGRVVETSDGRIRVTRGSAPPRTAASQPSPPEPRKESPMPAPDTDNEHECCSGTGAPSGQGADFMAYMGAAMSPGAVDIVTKQQLAVGLSLAVVCEPCTRIHVRKALKMGLGMEELEEIAALAMGFGGCRAMMLWNSVKKELAREESAR